MKVYEDNAAARLPDESAVGKQEKDGSRGAGPGNTPWFTWAVAAVVAFTVPVLIVLAGCSACSPNRTPIGGTGMQETDNTPVSEPAVTQEESMTDEGFLSAPEAPTDPEAPTEADGTAAPPVESPEDMLYAFVCGEQIAKPEEGLWWCEITQDDGSVLNGDGGGLSFHLTETENPPTVTVSANSPFLLTFVCRTGETVGSYYLWDETGGMTIGGENFQSLSELSDYVAGKPGTYFVTADIYRRDGNSKGMFTQGIRLIVE